MKLKVMLDNGAKMPTKAHTSDAGFDLYTPKKVLVPPSRIIDCEYCTEGCATIDTGVHIEIPEGYVGFIKSKSGLNIKQGITSEGVIDAGYTGSIVVKLYNRNDDAFAFDAGDKISQLVILPIPEVELELTDKFEETERGDNGFGSSGK